KSEIRNQNEIRSPKSELSPQVYVGQVGYRLLAIDPSRLTFHVSRFTQHPSRFPPSLTYASARLPFLVSLLSIEFRAAGLCLPDLGLWLDPQEPQIGPERVFVSHAHSDHIAAHREVILSTPTARLMQARVPGARREHILEFDQPRTF